MSTPSSTTSSLPSRDREGADSCILNLAALFTFLTAVIHAQPIQHTLSFPERQAHYVSVNAVFPTGGKPTLELMMAVWTPGSYLIRDYSRNVLEFSANAVGRPLSFEKTRKNRWRITTNGAPTVEVRYRVYSREASVRNNWIDKEKAILNGAPTFFVPVGDLARPHEVTLQLPPDWKAAVSSMDSTGPASFRAPDYDTLVDSPILAGNPEIHSFTVENKKHYLVQLGDSSAWKPADAVRDLEKIIRTHLKMWGSLPYRHFYFLNVLTPGGGGIEHKESTLMMVAPNMARTASGYRRWLSLASHESFHAWNVKRLRPVELGPFDYENEVYSRSLWLAEGVTTYYGALALHRAGLSTRSEFIQSIGGQISTLQTTPGRHVTSLEQSSLDAWIRQYKPDENSSNVSVSYYNKGAVVGFLLDAKIRKSTNGARGLDDWMRLLYQRYSGDRGFTPQQLLQAAEEVAGTSLRDFWRLTIETTEELDYKEATDFLGLQLDTVPGPIRACLGIVTKIDQSGLRIATVIRRGPAFDAGLQVDDEILAINSERVLPDQLDSKVESFKPGETVSILIARRGKLITLPVKLSQQQPRVRLTLNPSPSADQRKHLEEWLQ